MDKIKIILNDTSYIIILMTYDKNIKIKTNFAIIWLLQHGIF